MIITLTLNPSLDYTMTVDESLLDVEVNRTSSEQMKVGGKGLNVSMLLDKLKSIPGDRVWAASPGIILRKS